MEDALSTFCSSIGALIGSSVVLAFVFSIALHALNLLLNGGKPDAKRKSLLGKAANAALVLSMLLFGLYHQALGLLSMLLLALGALLYAALFFLGGGALKPHASTLRLARDFILAGAIMGIAAYVLLPLSAHVLFSPGATIQCGPGWTDYPPLQYCDARFCSGGDFYPAYGNCTCVTY